ncbi:MAG: helix-turn-helix domain-containing protein [Candidatus Heimdallarchaeaceae archaeon]
MESTLENLGLSKDEVQVYATIVQYGFRTLGQIQTYYKQPADILNAALSSLVGKGYIKEIKAKNQEGTPYFIPLPPQIKLTEDVSIRLENELKALSDDVKADWNKTMTNFRSQLSSFHNKITEDADGHATEITATTAKFLETLANVVASGKTETSEIIGRLKADTSSISSTNSDAIAKTAQRVKENVQTSFDSTIHKIGEHHDSFKLKIEETLGSLQTEHDGRVQNQLYALLEKVESIKNSLTAQVEEFNTVAAEQKSVVDTMTDEAVKKVAADSSVVSKDSTKKLSDTVNRIIAEYETKLDEYQAKVKEILVSLNDELKKLEAATTNRITTTIDKSKETAVNILKENEKNFVDLLNVTKVDSVEKLGVLITQTEAKTEEMKGKLSGALTSYLSDFKKNSDKLLSLLNTAIENGFNLFEENLTSSIENISNQIKQFVEEIMSVFRESTNAYLAKLSKTTAKYEKTLKERKVSFQTSHTEFKEGFTNQLKELKTSVVSNIESNVNENDEKLKILLTENENKFVSDVEAFLEEFSKRGRDVRDEVPNIVQINYQASLDRLNELQDQLKGNITKIVSINEAFQGLEEKQLQRVFGKDEGPKMAHLIGSMRRDIEIVKESVETKMGEMIQTFSSSMTSLSSEIFDKMNSKLDELSRFTTSTIQATNQTYDGSRNQINKQLTDSLVDMKTKINETYGTYEEQFNELQNTSTKKLADVVGAESKAFVDVTKSISGSLDELLTPADSTEDSEDQSAVHVTIKDGLDSLQATKQEIFDLMKKNNADVTSSLQETLKTNIDEHSQLVTKTNSSMDTTMKSLQSEFERAKVALDTDVSVALDEAAKNYSVQTTKVEGEINDLIAQDVQQFTESTEEVMAELSVSPDKSSMLDEAINHTKGELQQIGNSYPGWVKADTDVFASNLGNTIKEFQVNTQRELDTLYSRVQGDLQKTYDRMSSDFVSNVADIQAEFEKEKNDYELNITHQINSFITNSDSNSSALVTNIQGTKDALTEAITAGNSAVNTDLSNLEKTLSDLFDSYLNSFEEKLNTAETESKVVDEQKEQYNSKLMGFKEEFIKGTQGEIESVDTQISGTLSSIPAKISGVLDATGESMKLIKTVLSLGKGVEPSPIEDTWVVYGKEQANSSLMGIISRAKRGVTLITPDLDWVDVDLLEADPTISRKRLHFFFREDSNNVLSKLVELNAKLGTENLQMKNTSGNPKIFMCIRDGTEEGFLGYISQTGEPVVLITFNETMVSLIDQKTADYRR